jgi:hypothetical protein
MSGFSRNDPNIAMLEHVAVRLGAWNCVDALSFLVELPLAY